MKYEKICLIIPPSSFLLDERVFPFIGVLRVAAALEQAGIHVEVLDLSGIHNYKQVLRHHVKNSDIELYGITATTPQMPAAFGIANILKRYNKKSLLGGTHITLTNAARKKKNLKNDRAVREFITLSTVFDKMIAGDGEEAIFKIIEGDKWFVDADDIKSDLFIKKNQIDYYPEPARYLIDLDSYHYYIDGHRATSLISQLGCPFGCTFCAGRNSAFLRTARFRDIQSVISEMRSIYKTYGYTGFMFYDDELNVSPDFSNLMTGIVDLQYELGVEFALRGFLKAELFTEEQAAWMLAAGFSWLLIGFESGSERILTNIEKRATRDDNTKAMEIAKKHGLKTKALMSFGHAGESAGTMRDTIDWLLEVEPEDFDMTVITPYPGSPYYDDAVVINSDTYQYTSPKTGDKLYMKEVDYMKKADYYKGKPGDYVSLVYTDYITMQELADVRDIAEREVREKLKIPFNPENPATKVEVSMGQTKLPSNILRSTNEDYSS